MRQLLVLSIMSLFCASQVWAQEENMKTEKAILAGGCFWCIEAVLEKVPGIIDAVSGYTGGNVANPTYEQVSSGRTGHYEAVEVTFDPDKISYEEVLNVFWRDIDPTDDNGQFNDQGPQYRTAIFYLNDEQKRIAEESKEKLDRSGMFKKPVVTQVLKASTFYPAEKYHQDYSQTNSLHYNMYYAGSGRKNFVENKWKNAAPGVCPLPFLKNKK